MIRPTVADSAIAESPLAADAKCKVHPERSAHAKCSRCDSLACVTCANVLASGETLCPACDGSATASIAWERRRELGIARAFAMTVRDVLARPGVVFAQRARETSLAPALVFGLVLNLVGAIATTAANIAFAEQTRRDILEQPFGREFLWTASNELYLGQLAASPILYLVTLYSGAAFWWIGLRAVGGLQRPFAVIVRALAYTQAVQILLPLVAPLSFLGPGGAGFGLGFAIWALGIQIVAVSRSQGIELARGVMAFVVWLSLAGMLLCLATAVSGWALASQIRIPTG